MPLPLPLRPLLTVTLANDHLTAESSLIMGKALVVFSSFIGD